LHLKASERSEVRKVGKRSVVQVLLCLQRLPCQEILVQNPGVLLKDQTFGQSEPRGTSEEMTLFWRGCVVDDCAIKRKRLCL